MMLEPTIWQCLLQKQDPVTVAPVLIHYLEVTFHATLILETDFSKMIAYSPNVFEELNKTPFENLEMQ